MSTVTLEKLLARPGFVVMDGGMGTSIEDAGIDVANPLWGSVALLSEEGRATNRSIHEDFLNAGAEVLIANTHNASLAACAAFASRGYDVAAGFEKPEMLLALVNAHGVESATKAADAHRVPKPAAYVPGARVNGHSHQFPMERRTEVPHDSAASKPRAAIAGCVGSVEAPYATSSKLRASEVADRARPQVEVLARLPIDLLMFEMISTASEVVGFASLIGEHPELATGVGFTCGENRTTHGGVSMRDAVEAFANAPPRLYFIQCTRYDLVERSLIELIEAVGDPRKVGVYANDGRRWDGRRWEGDRVSPKEYAAHAKRWAELGVSVIGGCCGTKAEHIAALTELRSSR